MRDHSKKHQAAPTVGQGRDGDGAEPVPSALPGHITDFVLHVEAFRKVTPILSQIPIIISEDLQKQIESFVPPKNRKSPLKYIMDNEKDLTLQQQHEILGHLRHMGHYSTLAGRMPSMLLAAIIAEVEILIADTLRWAFQKKSELVGSIKRKIDVSDIKNYKYIREVIDLFVDKEIDEFLRMSPKMQVESIESLFNAELLCALPNQADFFEIFCRRNAIMHAGGCASRQYIEDLQKIKYPKSKMPSLGDRLFIDPDYFNNASSLIQNFFSLLAFRISWQLSPESRIAHDRWPAQYVYDQVMHKDYKTAVQFCEMITKMGYIFKDSKAKYRFIINHAQALKWSGSVQACESLLSKTEWDVVTAEYRICALVLLNKFEEAAKVLNQMGRSGKINYENICSWPVFREARENDVFVGVVERVFEKKLTVLPEVPGPLTRQARRQTQAATRKSTPASGRRPRGKTH